MVRAVDFARRNGYVSGWTVGHSEWRGSEVQVCIARQSVIIIRPIDRNAKFSMIFIDLIICRWVWWEFCTAPLGGSIVN